VRTGSRWQAAGSRRKAIGPRASIPVEVRHKASSDMLSIEFFGFRVAPDRHNILPAVNDKLVRLYGSGKVYSIHGRDLDWRRRLCRA
jgi:hypothetical protein